MKNIYALFLLTASSFGLSGCAALLQPSAFTSNTPDVKTSPKLEPQEIKIATPLVNASENTGFDSV